MVNHAREETSWGRDSKGRHAVVIGGSLAGLLAAHVLAGHADRVTVVERDRLPDGPEPRPGVPQSRHAHVLLESGQLALDSLLPGFTAELRAAGAPRVGMPEDMVAWSGTWLRRTAPTSHIHTGSRAQVEQLVRRRVLANPLITTVESAEAVGLAGDASRVRGVLLRERGGTDGTADGAPPREPRTLAADLVVDASGRSSRASQWLAAIGAEPPQEETIDTGQAYASRIYRNTSAHLGTEALAYWFYPNPSQTYAGGVLPAITSWRSRASVVRNRPRTTQGSPLSRRVSPTRSSTSGCSPPSRRPRRTASGRRPTCAAGTTVGAGAPPGSSPRGTRCAPSTRSTARACRSPR